MSRITHVLVLCTGNSARSIMGEVLINELGDGQVRAFSAGSCPTGQVNARAIATLVKNGHRAAGLESKSWDRFSGDDGPVFDLVITVCDNAAAEQCPVWQGAPVTVHWGIPDPAVDGDFDAAYRRLRRRVQGLVRLPIADLTAAELTAALTRVHQSGCRSTGEE